jgi:cytochrome c-type biogenesis protein CcmH
MGWIMLLLLAAAALGLLWRFGELRGRTLELVGAALFVGVAGYAVQGSPAQPGSPVEGESAPARVDVKEMVAQRAMRTGVGDEAAWLDMSGALVRAGSTESAAQVLQGAIKKNPKSADLWVGLGNALVAHGGGSISPSAQFAFQRAATLSPEHPGPPFFLGLALAQQGKTADAGQVWRGLLARTPDGAPWKADLEDRLAAIGEMPGGRP